MRSVALVLAGLCVFTLAGCTTRTMSGTASPADALPPPTSTSAAATPDDAFVADILDTPGLQTSMPPDEMITIGQGICDSIGVPGITRALLEEAIGGTRFGPEVAVVFIDAAETRLCPERSYSTAAAAEYTPDGPQTTFTAGTFEVGVDVQSGKYKTPGSDACYWARLQANDGSTGDIIDNSFGAGPQTVTINDGEYFETQGCGTWTLEP